MKHLDSYDNIIWDWNGTILNDVDTTIIAVNAALTELKLESITKDTYLMQFRFPVKDFYQSIGIDTKKITMDHVSKIFHDYYQKHIHTASIFQNIDSLLKELKEQNKKLYVLSAGAQWLLDGWVKDYQVKHFFDAVYGLSDLNASSKVSRGKTLIEKERIEASHKTIMIGDTLHDHEVANELGIGSILIAEGHQSYDRLQHAGCKVLETKYD